MYMDLYVYMFIHVQYFLFPNSNTFPVQNGQEN